jgi:predicted TIM-barrel fold metal-dependent hydrolase
MLKNNGCDRGVLVQPSVYGTDNSCMVDALRSGLHALRGIAVVEANVTDRELEDLHSAGVRGVRINVSPVQAFDAALVDQLLPRIQTLDARCAEIGWHLDFLLPGWLTEALLPVMDQLRVDHSLAHMGMFLGREGPAQAGFVKLLDRLRHGNGRTWVKFTGTYRMATAPLFADALPMAQALIHAAPDRIIWGSDYPHLSFADKVGSVQLFNLLQDWAPDAATRQKILTDNPAALFGF